MNAKDKKLKQLLRVLICIIMVMPNLAFAGPLTDVKGHWAESQITKWVDKGYIQGNGDGTFKPDKPITRAEFMAVVNRAFGFKDKAQALDYKDIKKSDWFYEDVAKAVNAGYISGCGNNTVLPGSNITNQEVAVVVSKLLKLIAPSDFDLSVKFKDSTSIAKWSQDAIKAVVSQGYMKGYIDQTFGADKPITRAEVVAVLDSCYLKHQKKAIYKAGEYREGTVEGSILIGTRGVTLKDSVINGDLILTEEIGDGEIRLKNVIVKGETIIKGGGMNSIYIEDSSLTHIIIIKVGNKVRVVAKGNTRIDEVDMQSGAKLEEQGVTGTGFGYVTIAEEVAENASIILAGNFASVQLTADNVDLSLISGSIASLNITQQGGASSINIGAGSTVSNMVLNAPVNVNGSGSIQTVQVNAAGSTLGINPINIINPRGVNVTINPPKIPLAAPTSSGGSSGGGGNSNSDGSKGDTTPPEVLKVTVLDSTKLEIEFSEAVDEATAENVGNYYIADIHNKGNAIRAIRSTTDMKRVVLIIREIEYMSFKITVNSVTDLKGNMMIKYSRTVKNDNVADETPPIIYKIEAKANNELRIAFNERIEASEGSSMVVSYGNPRVYIDLIWVGDTVIDRGTTMIFKVNRTKSKEDSYDISSTSHILFTGEEFLMNENTSYRIESIYSVRDFAGNAFFVNNDDTLTFIGVNATNDRPYVDYIVQYDEKRIRLGFSEPVLVPEVLITSEDVSAAVFNVKQPPLVSADSNNYLRVELEISKGNLIKGQTYELDFSSLEGLTDYCGTPVMDASDTEDDCSKYTSMGVGLDDDQGPSITWVGAINSRRICIEYDERVQDSLPTYMIVDSRDVQQGPVLKGYRDENNFDNINITLTSDLLPNHAYWVKPLIPAKDIVGNTASTVENSGVAFTTVDFAPDDCISSISKLDGKKLRIYLNAYTGGTDSISVVDAVYSEIELCEQLTVEDSIGFSAPNNVVTVTTDKPLMADRNYIAIIGGTSIGSSNLSKAVSYEFEGIVDDDIEIDKDDIIIFDDVDASNRAVYIVCNDARHLVVPESPLADFDGTTILDSIGRGSNYRVEVYGLEKLQDTLAGNWVGEYGEYSESNSNGFKLGPILYAREF